MKKVDVIITDNSTDLEEPYGDFVRLDNVKFEHISLLLEYAFQSGYDVLLRKCEEGE